VPKIMCLWARKSAIFWRAKSITYKAHLTRVIGQVANGAPLISVATSDDQS